MFLSTCATPVILEIVFDSPQNMELVSLVQTTVRRRCNPQIVINPIPIPILYLQLNLQEPQTGLLVTGSFHPQSHKDVIEDDVGMRLHKQSQCVCVSVYVYFSLVVIFTLSSDNDHFTLYKLCLQFTS